LDLGCPSFGEEPHEENTVKQCLIVDSSRVVRKVARRILEGLNFSIEEATTGPEALESVRRGMPDAILLDWPTPAGANSDFLRALRREPGGDKPIVIFAAIENDVSHISEAIKSGANDYIMKPFDRETLQATFTEVGLMN
jgi:two-component system chemotaxis response regulator CheY